MRGFVSVDLPGDLQPAVEAIQGELQEASGLTLTDPGQAHVTLKFLGDVDEDRIPELEDALSRAVAAADVAPFEATFAGLGAFPSEEYIRVVWLGVEAGSRDLTRLHETIEERVVELGFEPEEHSFTPHVTLARMEHAGGKELVQRVLQERPTVGTMTVEAVRLKRSDLRASGPVYSTVSEFPL